MSYLINTASAQQSLDLMTAGLVMSTYSAGAYYTYSGSDGTMALSITAEEITLTAGRYMIEAYPYADAASTVDVIKFVWQIDTGGGYADIGLIGQIQVSGDSEGDRDVALAQFDLEGSATLRLKVHTLTSTGTPTDSGGLVVIWRATS